MNQMNIVYAGVHREVAGTDLIAVFGEPIDVPDEVARRLLEQDCWSEHKPEQRTTTKTKGDE